MLLLLLLVAGGAGGWAYAEGTSGPQLSGADPSPVVAADPAIPFTPPEVTRPDCELPPLPQQLPTHDEKLGVPKQSGIVVPIPNAWERTNLSGDDQARWTTDDDLSGCYSLRVQVLDEARTLSQKVQARTVELPEDPRVSGFELIGTTGDTLKAEFILEGYSKLTVIRWVSLDGDGLADVEIAATGRKIDERGMEALVAQIATDVRRQPPPAPKAARQ